MKLHEYSVAMLDQLTENATVYYESMSMYGNKLLSCGIASVQKKIVHESGSISLYLINSNNSEVRIILGSEMFPLDFCIFLGW